MRLHQTEGGETCKDSDRKIKCSQCVVNANKIYQKTKETITALVKSMRALLSHQGRELLWPAFYQAKVKLNTPGAMRATQLNLSCVA